MERLHPLVLLDQLVLLDLVDPREDVGGVLEPDCAVVVPHKDALHSQDFDEVELLEVEAHHINLLETVALLIDLHELHVLSKLLEVVLDFGLRGQLAFDFGIEVNDEWEAASDFHLDVRLNVVDVFPDRVILLLVENIH